MSIPDVVFSLNSAQRRNTICDACTLEARVEIHLADSSKVLWLCSKHQRHLWSLAQSQLTEKKKEVR